MSLLSAGALPLVEAITLRQLGSQPGRYGPIRLGLDRLHRGRAGRRRVARRIAVTALPAALAILMLATLGAALAPPAAARARKPATRSPARHARGARASPRASATRSRTARSTPFSASTRGVGIPRDRDRIAVDARRGGGDRGFRYLPQLFGATRSRPSSPRASRGAARFAMLGWLAAGLWIVLVAQLLHAATFGSFHAAAVAACIASSRGCARARPDVVLRRQLRRGRRGGLLSFGLGVGRGRARGASRSRSRIRAWRVLCSTAGKSRLVMLEFERAPWFASS